MAWRIEFSDDADRDFSNLEKSIQRRVFRYLPERVVVAADPRDLGEPLAHDLAGLWRYRVGDYRVLCRIEYENLTVLVVEIGHRGTIYKR